MEFFSGVGSVHRAFAQRGFCAAGFDIINVPDHPEFQSITTDCGFMSALQLIRRLRTARGLSHWATVCSSWIWMSRSSTKRSIENPLGNLASEPVREGNAQVARMAVLIFFVLAKSAHWVLEQPGSSLMHEHPEMKRLHQLCGWNVIRTWMGMYGAATKKPTSLASNNGLVHRLRRTLDLSRAAEWNNSDSIEHLSDGRVSGKAGLKDRRKGLQCAAMLSCAIVLAAFSRLSSFHIHTRTHPHAQTRMLVRSIAYGNPSRPAGHPGLSARLWRGCGCSMDRRCPHGEHGRR